VENGNLLCHFSPIPLAKATLCEEHEVGANATGLGGWERKMSVQTNSDVRMKSVISTGHGNGGVVGWEVRFADNLTPPHQLVQGALVEVAWRFVCCSLAMCLSLLRSKRELIS
jgi:hypothetical protein